MSERRFIKTKPSRYGRGITQCVISGRPFFKFQIRNTSAAQAETGKAFEVQRHFKTLEDAQSFALEYFVENAWPEWTYEDLRSMI